MNYVKLALIASSSALASFGGSGKPDLFTITIASDGQPVAHTAHPKHRSRSTIGKPCSPMVSASGGHRSMQVSHASQRSESKRGSKPELINKPGLDLARVRVTGPQCQRSQLQITFRSKSSVKSCLFRLRCMRPAFSARSRISLASFFVSFRAPNL